MANDRQLTSAFKEFFESEKSGGIVLVVCTILSLAIANSAAGHAYVDLWHADLAGLSVELWINDGLMAVFFLLIGLELERELYVGELSDFRNALLPIIAAGGGVVVPALIHLALNAGTPTQSGIGIPMATDIAFALGALAILGKRVPASLKVFLVALAVMDDLVAVIVIAVFYTSDLSLAYLLGAAGVLGLLVVLNRLRVMSLIPYLIGGITLWYLMFRSGVHATLAGVLLAFAVPFRGRIGAEDSPSRGLEHFLHRPVAFGVLPLFALANTGIVIGAGALDDLLTPNSLGILGGLFIGKPLGITLACVVGVAAGVCRLPGDLTWRHVIGAGMLGGIGFTMSIFITNLAFAGQAEVINSSKLAILLASLMAGLAGCTWLLLAGRSEPESNAGAAA